MDQNLILWPVLTLTGWTFLILLLLAYRRFSAGFAGQVSMEDFQRGESSKVPDWVSIPNRVFVNLLEVPVLFYVLAILIFCTHTTDHIYISMAWIYVTFRVIHSLIYLTYNRVRHRFMAFAASNLIVLIMWFRLILALSGTVTLSTQ